MQQLRSRSDVRLWLSRGGHFAASSTAAEVNAREAAWTGLLQRVLQGKKVAPLPRVTWWYQASDHKTLVRRNSPSWPPPGVRQLALPLTTGTVITGGTGLAHDEVVQFAARTAGVEPIGRALKSCRPTRRLTPWCPAAHPSPSA